MAVALRVYNRKLEVLSPDLTMAVEVLSRRSPSYRKMFIGETMLGYTCTKCKNASFVESSSFEESGLNLVQEEGSREKSISQDKVVAPMITVRPVTELIASLSVQNSLPSEHKNDKNQNVFDEMFIKVEEQETSFSDLEPLMESSTSIDPQSSLEDHIRSMSSIRRSIYPCGKCEKVYSNASSLYRHLKLECGKLPQYHCPFCHFSSKRKFNLDSHVAHRHHGMKHFLFIYDLYEMRKEISRRVSARIQEAIKIFPTANALESVHKDQPCQETREFTTLGSRKFKKPFPCPQCDRSYKNKSSLNRHLQYECGTSKRYACPLCDVRMFHSTSLQEHIIFAHS
ncbi:zinc finger protein 425-like [Belonocnema kinseyi]|uniref:zinc finger protein 425-like n=1 Tax=Belonocnema kinseyi TaxID=2817044 RepID=UPI00143D101E|nr:zinc finger protein 425-like [Belonocnema kinseyi]